MKTGNQVDEIKRAKNIAAVLYLLVLSFVVGGTYINQQLKAGDQASAEMISEK